MCVEMGSYVSQAGLEFLISGPPPPKYWDHWCVNHVQLTFGVYSVCSARDLPPLLPFQELGSILLLEALMSR